jgi:hypothetical protein
MRQAGLRSDRRSAVVVIFAIMAVPMLGLVGLAIDYSIWTETYASLSLAANSAALNAAKVAATADVQNDSNFKAEGATAGQQWFQAELGQGALFANAGAIAPTVTITTSNANVIASVTFRHSVRPQPLSHDRHRIQHHTGDVVLGSGVHARQFSVHGHRCIDVGYDNAGAEFGLRLVERIHPHGGQQHLYPGHQQLLRGLSIFMERRQL